MKIPPQDIIVFGRSIGTGPATYLAGKSESSALVLFSPYTSLRSVAKEHVGCCSCCAPDIFKSIDMIKQIKVPIYLIHGAKDRVISVENTEELYKACHPNNPDLKQKHLPEHMTHNDFDLIVDFVKPAADFFKLNKVIGTTDLGDSKIPEAMEKLKKRSGPKQFHQR
jgi:abhydrolase domain-containing protein 17